tara:strand:+ start:1813 stop:3138 length:1326 start_codon:yes stop_codon:yes gene_type:complete
MSFAGLLGAGLLGGVANAAKGVGDKLREEAKQKREMALVDQAQVNAVALQEAVAEDNIDLARAKGEITIAVGDAGSVNNISEADNAGLIAGTLMAKQADIDSAAAVVKQANTITNLEKGSEIQTNLANLNALLKDATNVKQADLQAAQTKLQASIDKAAAKTKAGVNTEAASVAAGVAADTAETLAGTQMDMAVYDTGVNKDVAAALVKSQQETAAKLSETRMAELTANNAAAIAQINVAKVGDVQGFYNMTTGTEQMHVYDKDGNWKPQGGPKAIPAASKGSYTFENVVIDGKEVTGYMNGTDFVVVGTPVDDDTKNSNSWDAEKVTKFANKQSWLQMGVSLNKFGDPVGEIGPDERAKVSSNTAAIVKAWKADTSVDLATVMDNVFTGKTTGSTGGSTAEAQDLIKAQNAITDGAPFDTVVKSLKQKYPNIDTSGLKKK